MAIVKWNPLDDVVSFQRRINKMFEDTFLGKRALEEEELSRGRRGSYPLPFKVKILNIFLINIFERKG